VRLALGTGALDPTVDRLMRVQPPPRLEEAKRLLGTTLGEALPSLSIAKAQTALVQKLEKAGRTQDANEVRSNTTRMLRGREEAEKILEKLKPPHP
jgi:hypothetical protein